MPTLPNEAPPNVGDSTRVISIRVIRAWAGAAAPQISAAAPQIVPAAPQIVPAAAMPERARRTMPACVFIVSSLVGRRSPGGPRRAGTIRRSAGGIAVVSSSAIR
ncbi:MAG TPA: hypothetical protein VHW23_31180 [Kofleriaceae bacterium]|nr:hypothetical protein [Kofleriaceae bacterium]